MGAVVLGNIPEGLDMEETNDAMLTVRPAPQILSAPSLRQERVARPLLPDHRRRVCEQDYQGRHRRTTEADKVAGTDLLKRKPPQAGETSLFRSHQAGQI